ncbi:WecB/TagA/CpsF family glycosyltransferase [Klebsiella pneumoniae]|uniref:WecB/TagA/CpsF family glycosyltransferase n=1 Tax=Klebsiella pneumoniae TaxID=573 RepID=UPI003B432359
MPAGPVSRVAGADLWEALMQRAGAEGTPVFWLVVNLRSGADRIRAASALAGEHRRQRDGYFTPEQRRALFERIRDSGAKIVTVAMGSPRRDLYARLPAPVSARAVYGRRRHLRCFTGHVHRAPKFWQDLGLEWFYRLLLQPSRIKDSSVCCAIYVGIIPVSSDIPLQPGEFAYIFCVISSLA